MQAKDTGAGIELIVGLGGNLGAESAVRARFDAAIAAIGRLLNATGSGRAAIYRSAPVGPVADQPAFLNTAAAFDLAPTTSPVAAMVALLDIEAAHGRDREAELAQGPRALDLDILLWGGQMIDEPGPPRVRAPHPRLAARRFALEPLRELVGGAFVIPGAGLSVDECLGRAGDQDVVRL